MTGVSLASSSRPIQGSPENLAIFWGRAPSPSKPTVLRTAPSPHLLRPLHGCPRGRKNGIGGEQGKLTLLTCSRTLRRRGRACSGMVLHHNKRARLSDKLPIPIERIYLHRMFTVRHTTRIPSVNEWRHIR